MIFDDPIVVFTKGEKIVMGLCLGTIVLAMCMALWPMLERGLIFNECSRLGGDLVNTGHELLCVIPPPQFKVYWN